MQVQLTTNKQNSNLAFGKIYEFSGRIGIHEELSRILQAKGAQYKRDYIGAQIYLDRSVFHLATGNDSFTPSTYTIPMENIIQRLGTKVQLAGQEVVKIILDSSRTIEEQLGITLRTIGNDGKQEIDIVKK